jgi:polar amino acid transport system permease protein
VSILLEYAEVFAAGLALTLLIAVSASLGGALVGLLTAIARMSRVTPVRWLAAGYVDVIRNTPGLVQLFLIYLGLPVIGIRFSPLMALIVALTINNGAYLAEVFRAGLQAVPKGQLEAAASIALSRRVTFVEVVAPHMLRAMYPALTNQFIQTVLFSSIGTVVGVEELTQVTLFLESRTYRTVELLTVLTALYVVLTFALAAGSRWLGAQLEKGYR